MRRVVVTGVGVVSPIGIGREVFWKNATAGACGIDEISMLDTHEFKCHRGAEVKDFDPEAFIPKRKVKYVGRASQLAIAAAMLAIKDADLPVDEIPKTDIGVLVGTTTGERPLEELVAVWAKSGLKDIDRVRILQSSVNNISANINFFIKASGPSYLIPTACSAGNYTIGYGYDLVRSGQLDFALAGGADAFSSVAFAGFQRLYAMSADVCRPFDKNRQGMMLGEGAGILLLESLDSAVKRGAPIYAEVKGYGLSCDAHHATAPDAAGVARAMQKALRESGVSYKDVDCICAHGTGTPLNDKAECAAIGEVFKEHAAKIPVTAMKSMIAHTMGAASAIEAGACCLAIKNGIIPPTINFKTPDEECPVDCVPNKARKAKLNNVLNNGFAFGGNNACVLFSRYAG